MKKIGLKELNKYLSTKTEKELKEEIKALFKVFPDVKEYYQIKANPENEIAILEKYRKIIENEFWPVRGESKLRYSVMKKAITDFKKISKTPENIADLMISRVENGVDFTNKYGDMDLKFYNNILGIYSATLAYIEANDLQIKFKDRCKKVVENSQGIAWAFPEEMEIVYYEVFYDLEEEEDEF